MKTRNKKTPFVPQGKRKGWGTLESVARLVGDGSGGGDVEVKRDAGLAGRTGLGGADPEVDGTGGDEALTVGIDDGQFARREQEADGLGGVSVEVDAPESYQSAKRSAVDAGVGGVEFSDLVASDSAVICNGRGNGRRVVAIDAKLTGG